MIRFQCRECGKTLKVPASKAGKKARCPGCRSPIQIPEPTPVADQSGEGDWPDADDDDSDFDGDRQPIEEQPAALPPKRKRKRKSKQPSQDGAAAPSPYSAPQHTESVQQNSDQEVPTPPWAWAFFVACMAIMVLTRGGAIWGAIGGGVGGICLKVAQATSIPLAARIAICTVITGILWAGIIVLVAAARG